MALLIVFFGSILAACANFFFRKNQEHGGSSLAFLTSYYLFSLIISIFIDPMLFATPLNPILLGIGSIAGALGGVMMLFTAGALLTGPAGLTFAFQNAGAVLPSFLLFFLFGPPFDFILTPYHLIGIGAVLVGLYLGTRTQNAEVSTRFDFKKWIFYALAIFLLQGFILSIFQWRCLLFNPLNIVHPLVPWTCPANEDVWFVPGFFIVSFLFLLVLFTCKEKRWITRKEFFYGMIGGLFNGTTTFLLLLGTKQAIGMQKAVLFPFFAVSVILFCNIWGRAIYKEKVNWFAIALCIFGVFFSLI